MSHLLLTSDMPIHHPSSPVRDQSPDAHGWDPAVDSLALSCPCVLFLLCLPLASPSVRYSNTLLSRSPHASSFRIRLPYTTDSMVAATQKSERRNERHVQGGRPRGSLPLRCPVGFCVVARHAVHGFPGAFVRANACGPDGGAGCGVSFWGEGEPLPGDGLEGRICAEHCGRFGYDN